MKKTLVAVALLAGAVSGYSQGQVSMGDYGNVDFQISVWSPNVGSPTLQVQGDSSIALDTAAGAAADNPSGNTVYTGTPLGGNAADTGTTASDFGNGNVWSIQLYAAAGTVDSFSGLSPVAGSTANFFVDSTVEGNAGSWNSSSAATVPGVANGSPATLAIAAWYNGNGVYTSYAQALAAGQLTGYSTLGVVDLNGVPNIPPDLPGLGQAQTLSGGITSFNVYSSIPEPSTIALGVIGMSAFLMRLRRK
jgi:hypothetical protein